MSSTTTQYDLVIIGGGVAGTALATTMARSQARVLVLERDRVFRDRVRGEWLAPWGVAEARRLALMDAFDAAGSHQLPALAGRSGKPIPLATPQGDVPLTFSHPALQQALLDEAVAAGVDVIRGARVTDVQPGKDGGCAAYTLDGHQYEARGRMLVGADGRSSLVRKAIGGGERTHRRARMLAGVRLSGVNGDPAVGHFVINEEIGGHASIFKQGDGYARAYAFIEGMDASTFNGADGFAHFIEASIRIGIPAEVIAGTKAAGPLAAFVTDDSWVEYPVGDSMLLVGDAAGISDPTWGMGLALALRDARAAADALTGHDDWRTAADAYARDRAEYFGTVITVENWQSELQLTPGDEARRRRKHATSLWSKDPRRALDLPGLGPDVDTSEEARQRFFGEDVPMPEAPITIVAPSPQVEATDPLAVGLAFIDALKARDFTAAEQLLAPSMRMRGLLPTGAFEIHGSSSAIEVFAKWFQHPQDFEALATGLETVADRIFLRWRFSLRWEGEDFRRVVEQSVYAKVIDGRLAVVDLLCTGFRPVEDDTQSARPMGTHAA